MKTTWRLLTFLRPFAGEVFASILLGVGTVCAAVGLLGTSAYLIATAALRPSIAVLEVAIVGVRFFGISRGVLRYLERLVSHSVNFRLLAGLRVWFYQAVEPLVPGGLEDVRGGDLLNRAAADIEVLENFYVRAVAPPISALVVTLGVSWFAGTYQPTLGLVLAGGLALAGVAVPCLTHGVARRSGRRVVAARANLSAELVDGIQGLAECLANGRERDIAGRIAFYSREVESAQTSLGRAGALGNALSGLGANLTLWVLLVCAIPMVRAGGLDGVSLAVLTLVTLASFEAVAPLSQAAQHFESALASARRLFDLADQPAQVCSPQKPDVHPGGTQISVSGLSFRYAADKRGDVLRGIDLALPSAARIALVGDSGAGKSTLAAILCRLYDCPPGTVNLDGRDILDYDPEEVRHWVAYASQPVYLFSGTLRENLLLANPEASEGELALAVEVSGLDRLVQRLPAGLDGRVGSQGEQLSGGERQRVAVARVLLSQAELLILDEPTAGLDADSAGRLMAALREATPGRGLLVITHRLIGLEWFDQIVVLRDGEIIERGTHDALYAARGWYRDALDIQRQFLRGGEL